VLCACYALKLYLDGDLKQTYAVCGLALCSALAGPWVLLAIGAMFFFPYLNVKANNAAYEFCDSYTEE
jgi:hypothetical protein